MTITRPEIPRAEPLDLATWVDAVTRLQLALEQNRQGVTLAQGVRKAFHLAALAPGILWRTFAPDCSEDEMERILEQGDSEKAAAKLIGPQLEMETAKPDGKLIVSLTAVPAGARGTGTSADYGMAVLGALLDCMRAAAALSPDAEAPINPDQRRSQSSQHPSSSQH